jgi:selenocysteine lyase/cysteine desulfurase
MLALSHGSNVNGVVQDLERAREAFPDTPILLDAAQTAGVLQLNASDRLFDFLACSAHKGLLGPSGVGLCYISPGFDVLPLMEGGTGSASEQTRQPDFKPDRYESGTLNFHGIAGLSGALDVIEEQGLGGEHKRHLSNALIEGLDRLSRVRIHSPGDGSALLLSVTVEGLTPDQVARALEEDHGILVRPGLQCSPTAHRHLGTFPNGSIRLSPGWGNTIEQMERVVKAFREICDKV